MKQRHARGIVSDWDEAAPRVHVSDDTLKVVAVHGPTRIIARRIEHVSRFTKPTILPEALTGGSYLGWFAVMVFIVLVAGKVGYRPSDAWMLLIPFWNVYVLGKLLWRLACIQRHYWAPAPTF